MIIDFDWHPHNCIMFIWTLYIIFIINCLIFNIIIIILKCETSCLIPVAARLCHIKVFLTVKIMSSRESSLVLTTIQSLSSPLHIIMRSMSLCYCLYCIDDADTCTCAAARVIVKPHCTSRSSPFRWAPLLWGSQPGNDWGTPLGPGIRRRRWCRLSRYGALISTSGNSGLGRWISQSVCYRKGPTTTDNAAWMSFHVKLI